MEKKTSAQLKQEARLALKGNYGFCAGCLGVMAIAILAFSVLANVTLAAALTFMGLSWGYFGGAVSYDSASAAIQRMGVSIFAYALFAMAISIVVSVLLMGYVRACFRICRGERGDIKDLFFPFGKHIGKFIGLAGMFQIIPFLFGLVAGFSQAVSMVTGDVSWFLMAFSAIIWFVEIVAIFFMSLNYGMAAFIFIEDPETPFLQALAESRRIMKGNRLRVIWLGLTFLGMIFLAYASCGIGFLWVTPYMVCTSIYFYFDITNAREVDRKEQEDWNRGYF